MTITIEEANQILGDNFAEWVRDLPLTVSAVSDSGITVVIPFSPRLCRVGGIMCGQALVSAADTAMVIALASANGGMRPMTTVDLTSNFMRPIIDDDAVVDAKVIRAGRSIAFCTTEIKALRGGKISAFCTGTYALIE